MADVARSIEWYERAGFETSLHDASYGFAHRGIDLTIHLAHAEGEELPGQGSVYLHCQDADRVSDEWKQVGIEVSDLQNEDYGKREGFVTDPDGNVIRFGSPLR